ncbi:hypothetical protein B7P33_11695 [Sediminicola luteus]|uniref:Peptidase M14 domain-containing protein n=1 Tax=Sediminicola luteus TaxID=319238 RepID=A0A2A4G7E9_9FLAO|nr:hypothetical protein B7P33_11695 [Sediminicola luteus]
MTYVKRIGVLAFFVLASCSGYKYSTHNFPKAVDTTSKPIELQEKKQFSVLGVQASNQFASARLNGFERENDSTIRALIRPENSPINPSPWYAFKLWADTEITRYIHLDYGDHFHRYAPKISTDGEQWQLLDTAMVQVHADKSATLKLQLSSDTLWVAAQEIHDSKRVGAWAAQMAQHKGVSAHTAGTSKMGRELPYLDIGFGDTKKKPTLIIISRQHPPEVTGYLAMQAFVETLIDQGGKNGFLKSHRVLVYPILNPDGVDLGHFRHNTGGVDMNRDWAHYHQDEIKQLTQHMVSTVNEAKSKVVMGLDFHSTYKDVYYTFDETVKTTKPGLTKAWLAGIQKGLALDSINDSPSGIGLPVSKGWFYNQFKAESVTYEIGDDTPRDFIKEKGRVSAEVLMELLMSGL